MHVVNPIRSMQLAQQLCNILSGEQTLKLNQNTGQKTFVLNSKQVKKNQVLITKNTYSGLQHLRHCFTGCTRTSRNRHTLAALQTVVVSEHEFRGLQV